MLEKLVRDLQGHFKQTSDRLALYFLYLLLDPTRTPKEAQLEVSPITWQSRGNHVAITWRSHGNHVAITYSNHMAITWRRSCIAITYSNRV